jgi:hypothetical protein
MGAGSLWAEDSGGVMSGRRVVRASGRRRVRKSVDDWRYVFEIWEGCLEAVVEADREEMEEARRLWEKVSDVEGEMAGLRAG